MALILKATTAKPGKQFDALAELVRQATAAGGVVVSHCLTWVPESKNGPLFYITLLTTSPLLGGVSDN